MDTTELTEAERIKAAITQTVTDVFKNKKISEARHNGTEEAVKAAKDAEVAAEEALQVIITNVLIDFNRIARALEERNSIAQGKQ